MAVNERVMSASCDAVWAVLSDGTSYRNWVVGTSDIRRVDDGFPSKGKKLHYSIGVGPLRHEGDTEVLDADEGRRLVLEAHAWPAGSMRIEIELTAAAAGGCRVRIDERPSRGLARRLHNPIQDLVLHARNVECLRRLERLAQQRTAKVGAAPAQR